MKIWMLSYMYGNDGFQMDFSSHLFFSLWIYDSMRVS